MIGPHAYRLPREDYSEELSFSANRPVVLELAERMGVPSAGSGSTFSAEQCSGSARRR